MSFSTLTVAQLEALRDKLYTAVLGSAVTIIEHTALGVGAKRLTPKQALDALREVDEALAQKRAPAADFINVYFGEPE